MREKVVPSKPNMASMQKSRYRQEIDGLRAFAIVAVIINHFNKDLLPSGYLGVDIFFVISGYVITLSLAGRNYRNLVDFLTGFYERRIKRLVPALIVFTIITSVLICFFNPKPDQALKTGGTALFGLSNLYLLKQSTDYFAHSSELNPFTHTWALSVEWQFYLLFPFLVWFSGFNRQTATGARNLFLLIGVMTIASLIGFIYLYQVNQPAAYFLMPTRFWEMAAGYLVFIGFENRKGIEQIWKKAPPLLVVAAMVGLMFLPVSAAVPATIGIVVLSMILITCLRQGTALYSFFSYEKVVFVGLISYSLYLWHWSVLSISRWTIGIHWWSVPIQVAIIALIAIMSYKWIETPQRQANWTQNRSKNIGIGITSSAGAAILLFGYVIAGDNFSIYLGSDVRAAAKSSLLHPPSKQCNIYEDHLESVKLSPSCGATDFPGRPTIYSLGDSHSAQFNDSLASFAKLNSYNYIFVWGNSCLFPAAVVRKDGQVCFDRQKLVERALLSDLKKNDIVFIGNALYSRFNENWSDGEKYFTTNGASLNIADAARMFSQRVQQLSDEIVSRGAKVVLYIDGVQFPGLKGSGSMCRLEWFRPEWSVATQCFQRLEDHLLTINMNFSWRKDWEDRRSRIVWNAYEYGDSCLSGTCNAAKYNDSSHFTSDYAAWHFNAFAQKHRNLLISDE